MAATLLTLRTRAKRLADMENSSFVADAEWLAYINEGKAELHEILVGKHEDYSVTSCTIPLVAGTDAYALPDGTLYSSALAFLKERGVDLVVGSESYTLEPFEFRERNRYSFVEGAGISDVPYRYSVVGDNLRITPAPTASGTLTLWYVPQSVDLSADGDTLPASMATGWERYLVVYAAMRALMKEESDVSALMAELARSRATIEAAAGTRRAGDPRRVVDVRYSGSNYWGRR